MTDWNTLDQETLKNHAQEEQKLYDEVKAKGLSLDMTRGKPCPEQLDLANGILACLAEDEYKSADGVDCRNYGGLDGLPAAKEVFAPLVDVSPAELIIGGNSSLQMMHDTIMRALLQGVPGGKGPWCREEKVKFLCPAPGYDRHFAICEHYGIEMINITMLPTGPDMDEVEKLVAADSAIKGIWCVPKYSNPTGITFSDEVVDRLAEMATAAPDFRIFWDNAYAVHHLYDARDELKDILSACKAAGNPDRVYIFGSTSKVSFAGSGLGFMGASETNIADAKKHIAKQTIGPDKLNQLRHIKFFRNADGVAEHMEKHAAVIAPKFKAVLEILAAELGEKGIAAWSNPKGGYFISLDVTPGCAAEIVSLAADAGVKLTSAGATFPYGKDPEDKNIRIAPTLPGLDEIHQAMKLVCICIKLVTARKLG